MKLMKRTGIYKASNVSFDPTKISAYSYAWWKFVGVVEGKVIFNNFRYSPSTGKHQYKVRSLLEELGIKIDMHIPLRRGLQVYEDLETLFLEAETELCDEFLENEIKKQERYQRTKARKVKAKLEDYLENSVAFRDYEILPTIRFGHYNKVAVHQVVDVETLKQDVDNALYNFHRDGFGNIVFYVEGL